MHSAIASTSVDLPLSGKSSWIGVVQPRLWAPRNSGAHAGCIREELCGDPQPRMSRIRPRGLFRQAPRLAGMAFHRGIDGSEPVGGQPREARVGIHEEHRATRSWRLGTGTLACPLCDAPIALGGRAVTPVQELHCPYCRHRAPMRDFLSLAAPSRPARVQVRLRLPAAVTDSGPRAGRRP
jgi:hypothetical protein